MKVQASPHTARQPGSQPGRSHCTFTKVKESFGLRNCHGNIFHKGSFEVQNETHNWVLWRLCFLSLCFPVSLAARLTPAHHSCMPWWVVVGGTPVSCKALGHFQHRSRPGETNGAGDTKLKCLRACQGKGWPLRAREVKVARHVECLLIVARSSGF